MKRRTWFQREFELGMPVEAFPDLIERLRGTPLRLEERTSALSPELLTRRDGERWSLQEHVGHLVDLESLWAGRVDDFDAHQETLRPADLENRATWDADHNTRFLADLLADFSTVRSALIARCEKMSVNELLRPALHPRLKQPMTVVDHILFVAEHDDHHLAAMTELRRTLR